MVATGGGRGRGRPRLRLRARSHGESNLRTNSKGPPQHGHVLGGRSGLGGGRAAAPTSSGRPVWKAMRSRLALAAGWQKP